MRKALATTVAAAVLLLLPAAPAFAGGSDDPVPYEVGPDGLTLPDGAAFDDGGHVNVRYTVDGGAEREAGIHFEKANGQASGAYVDEDFLPWSAITALDDADDACITWVQVAGYNEHYGEGQATEDQPPVCLPHEVTPPQTPTDTSTQPPTEAPSVPDASTPTDGASTPTDEASSPAPDASPSTESSSAPSAGSVVDTDDTNTPAAGTAARSVVADVEAAPSATPAPVAAESVPVLPQTGATVVGFLVAAVLLVAAGVTLVVVRRRRAA